jgi:hypothetical protein
MGVAAATLVPTKPRKDIDMKKNFANKWWVNMLCYSCAILIVQALLRAAGVEDSVFGAGFSLARLAVWACCLYVVERIIRFALWAVVLVVAPGRAHGIS